MELAQWVVPLETGEVAVGWAPVWAERMPATERWPRPVRRRGTPLVSRWLPCPLVLGVVEGTEASSGEMDRAAATRALRADSLSVELGIALDGPAREAPLHGDADDVRFAGLFQELVRVVADLTESVGVPLVCAAPASERSGLELRLGALGAWSPQQLADAVVLLRVATETCLQARGLQLLRAQLRVDGAAVAVDGRVLAALCALHAAARAARRPTAQEQR